MAGEEEVRLGEGSHALRTAFTFHPQTHSWATAPTSRSFHFFLKPPGSSRQPWCHEENTLVFIVNVKVSKHQIKQAMKKLYDIDVAKVNTLTRPDGEKRQVFLVSL
ncbi:60S ribosomal protein L23a [Galemys pyrenaicus]|uniref:60S ribosomal protein L23a n=1 Tax=Galemys pyrenaicus TaxID=202257 RepID=A0A8J6DDM1_GALPY|nr:60S ribosomal protein L23a [Galemys pyrenaicus]